MKSLIDKHTKSLLLDLKSIEQEHNKENEIDNHEYEREIAILESFRKYCEEMKDKGTSYENVRTANDLHIRAVRLK